MYSQPRAGYMLSKIKHFFAASGWIYACQSLSYAFAAELHAKVEDSLWLQLSSSLRRWVQLHAKVEDSLWLQLSCLLALRLVASQGREFTLVSQLGCL